MWNKFVDRKEKAILNILHFFRQQLPHELIPRTDYNSGLLFFIKKNLKNFLQKCNFLRRTPVYYT